MFACLLSQTTVGGTLDLNLIASSVWSESARVCAGPENMEGILFGVARCCEHDAEPEFVKNAQVTGSHHLVGLQTTRVTRACPTLNIPDVRT